MAWIALTKGFFAEVDDNDFKELSKFRWQVSRSAHNWYASRWLGGRKIYMHRQIAGPGNGQIVHHIDGVSLNNRRNNLKCMDQQANLKERIWG